ncbi:hypothetical protein NXX02_21150 [Bacteroides fragilis]|nr:hypothetical protein [Bacteroides fragilis]
MDKKEKNFATYKEFAKMLREVANIYSKLGDEPLLKKDMSITPLEMLFSM